MPRNVRVPQSGAACSIGELLVYLLPRGAVLKVHLHGVKLGCGEEHLDESIPQFLGPASLDRVLWE
jgi:hypothetical protein